MEEQIRKKRVRDDHSEQFEVGSCEIPEMKRIKEDLLDFLDDSELVPVSQDLDSVMKSFEEQISNPVVDLTSDSGESRLELGYLLEASDDELGLPPSRNEENGKKSEAGLGRVDSVGIGELWGFEEKAPSYDSFEELGGYVAELDDGLFEYSNVCFDSSEFSDYSWRLENGAV